MHEMRRVFTFVLLVTLFVADSFAQDTPCPGSICTHIVPVKVNPQRAASSCEVSIGADSEDLHFGTLSIPSSGELIATIHPAYLNGRPVYEDESGNSLAFPENTDWSIGKMSVSFPPKICYTYPCSPRAITIHPIEGSLELECSACPPSGSTGSNRKISYRTSWGAANARDDNQWLGFLSSLSALPGATEMFFQLGGWITIPAGISPGTYEGTLDVMVSCD